MAHNEQLNVNDKRNNSEASYETLNSHGKKKEGNLMYCYGKMLVTGKYCRGSQFMNMSICVYV